LLPSSEDKSQEPKNQALIQADGTDTAITGIKDLDYTGTFQQRSYAAAAGCESNCMSRSLSQLARSMFEEQRWQLAFSL
jgi:hypothetical protein